jgi:single-strand DNA-binding protein
VLNKCEFIGHLGADPEVRNTQSGDKIVNLRLAVTEKWKNKTSGEWQESTEWIPVAVFNQSLVDRAERMLKKGSKLYVSGAWKSRKWQDQSGADRYVTELVLQNFRGELIPLDPRPQTDQSQQSKPQQSQNKFPGRQSHEGPRANQSTSSWLEDDLPFEYQYK